MCTQRTGLPAPAEPATSSSPQSSSRLPTVSTKPSEVPAHARAAGAVAPEAALHALRRLRQNRPEHRLDLAEVLAVGDQRRRELDHRIAAIVRAADQPAPVQ